MSKVIDLKGSILSLTVLHVYSDQISDTKQAIDDKVRQAPDFFNGVPVVIQPEVSLEDPTFLALLVEYLYQLNMVPIGIRTEEANIQQQAEYAGLAVFPKVTKKASKKETNADEPPAKAEPSVGVTTNAWESAMVVNGSVRSGQQIYAKQRDLVIMGSINPGAEVIADGHVHVYGKIRGKVFAGSSGLETAKIFAKSLDPELVCIAGMYQLSEDIDPNHKKGEMQIALKDEKLVFASL